MAARTSSTSGARTKAALHPAAAARDLEACKALCTHAPLDYGPTPGGCAGLGAYPVADCPADYDIVKLSEDGTELSFGARPADNNMCTPENRPTTFEGGAMVTKQ